MPEAKTIWKRITVVGIGIVIAGATALGCELAGSEFFEKFYDESFLTFLIGLLILLVGLIGWATQLGRRARVCMAAFTLAPLPLIWIGGFLSNANIHGLFAGLFLGSVPLFAVGIILGIMSLASRRA